jgi:uncharacterized protein YoaH (UPF0181 family)
VIDALIANGIHEDFAFMFVKKGMRETGTNENNIDEKTMGIVLQQHVFEGIQMFMDSHTAQRVIDKVTLTM